MNIAGYEQFGWGREMGEEVIGHCAETKAIAVKL